MPIFFLIERKHFSYSNHEIKMGVTVLVFAVEQQKVCTKCISSEFWERTGASFKMACIWKGGGGGLWSKSSISTIEVLH